MGEEFSPIYPSLKDGGGGGSVTGGSVFAVANVPVGDSATVTICSVSLAAGTYFFVCQITETSGNCVGGLVPSSYTSYSQAYCSSVNAGFPFLNFTGIAVLSTTTTVDLIATDTSNTGDTIIALIASPIGSGNAINQSGFTYLKIA